MTYLPSRWVIAIALPEGPDATTHAPVRGAPPAPSTNPVITPARGTPADRPGTPPDGRPASAARILASAPWGSPGRVATGPPARVVAAWAGTDTSPPASVAPPRATAI